MTHTPHDALFKYVFGKPHHVAGELRAALPPELVAELDFDQIEEKSESLLDPSLTARYCDLLFKVKLKGRDAYVFVLHEHHSTELHLLAARLLVYTGRIMDDYLRDEPDAKTVPAVLALVLYQGPGAWTGPRELLTLYDLPDALSTALRDHLPNFRVLIDELDASSDEDLRAREATALGKLGWLLLKHGRTGDLGEERLRSWSDLLAEVEQTGSEQDLQAVGSYTLLRTNIPQLDLAKVMFELAGEKAREAVMTTGEQLIEQGREQGRLDGEQKLLLHLLKERFGELSAEIEQRIRTAAESEVTLWASRTLKASSLDEVFAPN